MRAILGLIVANLFLLAEPAVVGNVCGGVLEEDGGELSYPAEGELRSESICVWVVKAPPGNDINFILRSLSPGSSLSLYPERNPSEAVLTPIKLGQDQVDTVVLTGSQTVIVVLTQETLSNGVSFLWRSVESGEGPTRPVRSVGYFAMEEGRMLSNYFVRAKSLTWVLNLEYMESVRLEVRSEFEECQLLDPCQCSYFAVYEVMRNEYLREVVRTCGQSLEFRADKLLPQLIAFGYVNPSGGNASGKSIEMKWFNYPAPPGPTTLAPEVTTFSGATTDSPIHSDCGGLVTLDPDIPSIIEYQAGENSEACVWSLSAIEKHDGLRITFDYQGFEDPNNSGLTLYYFDQNTKNFTGEKITPSHTGTTKTYYTHQAFLFFSSDNSFVSSSGFQVTVSALNYNLLGNDLALNFHSPTGFYVYPETSDDGDDYYGPNERVTVLINPVSDPQKNSSVFLTFLDLEKNYDLLEIYTLLPYHLSSLNSTLLLHGRFTGLFPSGIPEATTVTTHPRLIFFTSNGAGPGRGFQLAWL